ncbi:hypothetical protein J2S42_002707 [Catenuloplanes indicus]|uniref:Uncharacterized protein n=1 Tax=Catenuloplanes indicus TaxID=137267 RepID=A0AAE3VXX0_9ACTN|nr:hypothetical protein [Catenuloplanes indicus]
MVFIRHQLGDNGAGHLFPAAAAQPVAVLPQAGVQRIQLGRVKAAARQRELRSLGWMPAECIDPYQCLALRSFVAAFVQRYPKQPYPLQLANRHRPGVNSGYPHTQPATAVAVVRLGNGDHVPDSYQRRRHRLAGHRDRPARGTDARPRAGVRRDRVSPQRPEVLARSPASARYRTRHGATAHGRHTTQNPSAPCTWSASKRHDNCHISRSATLSGGSGTTPAAAAGRDASMDSSSLPRGGTGTARNSPSPFCCEPGGDGRRPGA